MESWEAKKFLRAIDLAMDELARLRMEELEDDLSPGERCERAMQVAIDAAEAEVAEARAGWPDSRVARVRSSLI